MGHENSRPDLLEQGRDCFRVQVRIKRSRIRCDLTEVLVQCLWLAGELHARKEFWPDAEAERAKPVLLIGLWRDRGGHRAAARAASTRLIKQVNRKTASQEYVLKSLAPVRRSFPCF